MCIRDRIHPITGKPCPVPAKGWRFTDKTMDELVRIDKIEYGEDETTQPRQKYYLKDNMEAVSYTHLDVYKRQRQG